MKGGGQRELQECALQVPTHYASCLRLAPHSLTFRAKNINISFLLVVVGGRTGTTTGFTTHSSPFFPSGAMIDRKGFHDDPLNSLFDRVSGRSAPVSFKDSCTPYSVRSAQLRGLVCKVIKGKGFHPNARGLDFSPSAPRIHFGQLPS